MDDFYEEFIFDLEKNGVDVSSLELMPILFQVEQLVGEFYYACTKQELVSMLLNSYTTSIQAILNDRNLIPGYLVALKVGNIKIQFMDDSYVKCLEKKINRSLFEKWVQSDPLSLPDAHYEYQHFVKNFVVDDKQFQIIDPRLTIDRTKICGPGLKLLEELSIKLMFLEKLLMKYEKTNEKVKIIEKLK